MLRFFAARAGWFVLAACILLPLTIVAWLAISTTAGISAFYHPLHQGAPINRFEIQAVNIALAANFIAAIASSILLALKFRLAASAVVVGCWSLFLVASTGARLLVKPTPSAKFMMVCCKPAGLNRNLKSDLLRCHLAFASRHWQLAVFLHQRPVADDRSVRSTVRRALGVGGRWGDWLRSTVAQLTHIPMVNDKCRTRDQASQCAERRPATGRLGNRRYI